MQADGRREGNEGGQMEQLRCTHVDAVAALSKSLLTGLEQKVSGGYALHERMMANYKTERRLSSGSETFRTF